MFVEGAGRISTEESVDGGVVTQSVVNSFLEKGGRDLGAHKLEVGIAASLHRMDLHGYKHRDERWNEQHNQGKLLCMHSLPERMIVMIAFHSHSWLAFLAHIPELHSRNAIQHRQGMRLPRHGPRDTAF